MCSNHIVPTYCLMLNFFTTVLPIFFSVLLTCSLLVLLTPNPVHAVLFLVLLFCLTAALLVAFQFEFLAVLLLLIYVGAVTILFLFVIMMLDIPVVPRQVTDFYHYLFVAAFILLAFGSILSMSTLTLFTQNVTGHPTVPYLLWVHVVDTLTNTETIGQILYTFYLAFFLIAGIILLIALIGAVTLTHQLHVPKEMDVATFQQMARLKNHSLFNIH